MPRHPARLVPRLTHLALAALLALPVLVGGVREAEAGAPPVNWTYRDRVHKFSFKMFRDYKAVPLKTDEKTFLCKFRDPKSKGQARGTYDPEVAVIKVVTDDSDKPVTTGGGEGPQDPAARLRELLRRLNQPKDIWEATVGRWPLTDGSKKSLDAIKKKFKSIKSKDKPGIPGKLWQFDVHIQSRMGAGMPVHVTMAAFTRSKTSIVVFMNCGGPLKKGYASSFKKIARSFKWTDKKAKDVESLDVLDGVNITAKKRGQIERGMVKGWDVIVSPKKNYIVIYNTKNSKNNLLARVIAKRIEMIREQIYEKQFPPAHPINTVCIVRVCGDMKEYHAYGGPRGSGGYWSSRDEELVFPDASASRKPDDDTLAVLYHEAFHQYIYYSVGNVAPHPWFNEGHGDYYAGAKLKGRKFKIKPFRWRIGTVKNAIVQGPRGFSEVTDDKGNTRKQWERRGYTPLEYLVRFSQREYYAYAGVSYAQGWSLIYFLREIVPKNKKYNAKWGHILQTYFDVLQREVNKDTALTRGDEGTQDGGAKDGDKGGDKGGEKKADDEGEDDDTPKSGKDAEGDGTAKDDGTKDDGDAEGDADEPPRDVARVIQRGLGGPAALKKAVDEAFKGVDWAEFEKAWLEATKKV